MSDDTGTQYRTMHEIHGVGDDASAVLAFVDLLNARVDDMKNSVAKLPAEFAAEQEVEGLVNEIDDTLLLTAYLITDFLGGRTLSDDRVDDLVHRLLDERLGRVETSLPDRRITEVSLDLAKVNANLALVLDKLGVQTGS